MNSKKASGADEISVTFLKLIKELISPLLSSLINESFSSGTYPNCLKIAKVIPIYKGGTKSTPGNYRPISLLSILNKIIEKTIYTRLNSYFNKYNLINNRQFGFRTGHNTTMAVAELYEKVLKAYDNGDATCAVFLDLSKAFDSVNHDIILHKLYKYGVRGNVWRLIQSYLTSRKQFVFDNNMSSDFCNVDVGVPQGSVLGPLLFIIHINDLINSTNLNILNFADDTLLYFNFNNTKTAELYLNKELSKVMQWLDTNNLKLNIKKTKYMIFAPNQSKYNNINLQPKFQDSTVIEKVYEYKYLGLIIDHKLTWKTHISYLKGKLSQSLGILYKLRHLVSKKVLITVFHSLFLSHLNYGILCWGRSSKTVIEPLVTLTNKALRCINFCDPREHVEQFLLKDHLLQVNEIFQMELAKFMYKYNNNSLPVCFNSYFTKVNDQHNYNTRASKSNFFIPRKLCSKGQRSLDFLGPGLWSEIPGSIKNKKSLSLFISSYKSILLNKYNLR